MTPEQRKAVERLAVCRDAGVPIEIQPHEAVTLLALVREPVASVEATVCAVPYTEQRDKPEVKLAGRGWFPAWPGAKNGAKVRIDVHAVDAGEEK